MIIHSPAIVLRAIDYRESSKIVTLFTQTHGKVAVIVKGSKKSKSSFSGLLEIGNILDIVFYFKGSRSVQNLTKASYRAKTYDIRLDLAKMATSTATLEMVEQLIMENQISEELYEFTEKLLVWLHETKSSPRSLFPYIQIRLAELMGIGLRYELNSEAAGTTYLNIDEGNISTDHGAGLYYKLSTGQTTYIRTALGPKKGFLLNNDLPAYEIKNLVVHLDVYLKHHIDGLRDRKSDKIFHQIL
ncbi:MAG: DNA repair protein RecO [Balneolales bacterium]